jgi:hypothetical protein
MYLFDMFMLRTQTRDIISDKQYIVDLMFVNTSQDPDPDPSFQLTLKFGNVIYLIKIYNCTKYENVIFSIVKIF